MANNTLVTLLTGINLALLIALLYVHITSKKTKEQLEETLRIRKTYNYDELLPSIVYSKDNKVDIMFREVMDKKNRNLSNCINANVQKLDKRTKALITCLPLFKEYKMTAKAENKKLVKDIPNFVPKFGEISKVVAYPFNKISWKKLYKKSRISSMNPLYKLGFYENSVKKEMYDDDPNIEPDFKTANMGLYNFKDYCQVHDVLIFGNRELAFQKNFITDYHQMSLPRMFVMNKIGQDLMPKFSKNMPKINWYQKLYTMDLRANLFYFKKASFHTHHKLGQHFGCYGQSYNHIPGHGGLVRKDLLTGLGNDWSKKFENNEKCKAQLDYYPKGYRLYIRNECLEFFKILNSKKYEEKKRESPIQFIMKIGHSVHRGLGVSILDPKLETEYRENYENGKKCGIFSLNEIAQEYVGNPSTFKGFKFDFRMYMLISSVNPMKVYYHDGFLRVSLSKWDKFSMDNKKHITNTSVSAKLIEKVRVTNGKYLNMTYSELKDFQMQTLEQYGEFLVEDYNERVKRGETNENTVKIDKNWIKDYLIPEFKRSYISAAKLIQKNLYKSSDVFEMFGVDVIMDENYRLYIIEINASPMVIGTAKRKTKMMTNMVKGLYNIIFAQQFSRVKRTMNFIDENKKDIMKKKNLEANKKKFNQLYQNYIDDEYLTMLENNPWEMIYDSEKKDKYERYMGLIDRECIDIIEE